MKKRYFLTLVIFLVITNLSKAQLQFLDPTFGLGGRFSHLFFPNYDSDLYNTALQEDGKIVACGNAGGPSIGEDRAIALRVTPNGLLDENFGTLGKWISNNPGFVRANQIVVQPDGKILIAGNGLGDFYVIRLLSNGDYDSSFGVGGKTIFNPWDEQSNKNASDLVLQPNGKILLAGSTAANKDEVMIARIDADGSLDNTFGQLGVVKIHRDLFAANSVEDLKVGLLSNNSILAAGYAYAPQTENRNFILRYDMGGIRDTSFGGNGIVYQSKAFRVADLFVLPGDFFYLLSNSNAPLLKPALYKYTAQGILDSSYANNGVGRLTVGNFNCSPYSGYLQADGKVLIFGGPTAGIGFLGRLNEDGTQDNSFGINGIIRPQTDFEIFYGGFAQPDGRVVTAGRYFFQSSRDSCSLLRYLGSNSVGIIEAPSSLKNPLLYPNPIRGQEVTIAYELPTASLVTIEFLDIHGKSLTTLLNVTRPHGKNEESVTLPPNLTNGFYLLNIKTLQGNAVIKLILNQE